MKKPTKAQLRKLEQERADFAVARETADWLFAAHKKSSLTEKIEVSRDELARAFANMIAVGRSLQHARVSKKIKAKVAAIRRTANYQDRDAGQASAHSEKLCAEYRSRASTSRAIARDLEWWLAVHLP